MSRTIRIIKGKEFPDSAMCRNPQNDKNPRKRFMWRGDGWSSKARGGVGNKAGWNAWMPKWLYRKYKKENNEK